MNLNLKRLSLATARLEILIQAETDLKAQFLELAELRERLSRHSFRRIYKTCRGLESPRPLLSPLSPSVRGPSREGGVGFV